MRYCSKCGKEVQQNMIFCGNCGAPLRSESRNPKGKSTKNVIVLFFIILLLAVYLLDKTIYTVEPKTNQISARSSMDKMGGRELGKGDAAAAVEAYLEAKIFHTLSDTEYYEVKSSETYRADNKIYVPIYAPTGDSGLAWVYVAVINATGAVGDAVIFYKGDDSEFGERLEEFNAYDYL